MAKVVVHVCDECGVQEYVQTFEIRSGSKRVIIDLCEAHSGPLEEYLTKGTGVPEKSRAARTRPRKPTSMSEIEALRNQ